MNHPNLPKYAVRIRWGTFSLDIVGRRAILAWLAVLASLATFFGLRHLL